MIYTFLTAFIFILCASPAFSEERWVSIQLERSPIINRHGNKVDRPVFYSKKQTRLTKGGEWIVPDGLKIKAKERYQRAGDLLMLVDVPSQAVLPGEIKAKVDAEKAKKDIFKIAPIQNVESGVTK